MHLIFYFKQIRQVAKRIAVISLTYPERVLIYADMDAAFSFRWLYDHSDRLVSVPLVLIGFTGCLTDKGFPGDICSDLWVAVAVSNPADHGIRVDGDCIMGINITEYDWVSVR